MCVLPSEICFSVDWMNVSSLDVSLRFLNVFQVMTFGNTLES